MTGPWTRRTTTHCRRTSLRTGIATASLAVSAVAVGDPVVAGGSPIPMEMGPVLATTLCAESHTEAGGGGFVFWAFHEPGETHRYQWILSIDGKDALGGLNKLHDAGPDALDGETFVIPTIYPVHVGSTYRLRVADRDAQPDRIRELSTTLVDCDERRTTSVSPD